jgi:HEAT repeat protein
VERPLPALRPGDTVESQRAILADPGRTLEARADAAFRLGALSRDPGDAERLADLFYGFPPVDVGARQGLERMGGVAVEPLIRVLRDAPSGKKGARSERPRYLAAKAAETVRDPRLKVETMRLLGEVPKEGFVAESLARGLGNYGDAEAAEALVRIVLAEHRGRRREESFRSLIRIGPPAIGPLSATLGRSTTELQVEVIYCLMKIGDRESVPALIASLNDSDPYVRWAARCALASIGDPPGAIPQIESWRSRDAAIRREATLGILAMGPLAKKPFLDALRDPDPGIRWRAAWCLGWIGDPALAEPLGLLKDDGDRNVRWLGAEAIARIGEKASAESLRGYCSETDPGIRRIADEALTASGREGCSNPR